MPVLFDSAPDGCIKIGLINNMSDEALKATDRQFVSLLNLASDNMPVHLSFYTLPGVPRNGLTANHISSCYSNIRRPVGRPPRWTDCDRQGAHGGEPGG